ncbi:hypothetical protein I7I50_04242 [Histoplasma capsulatum G186AR]|uniref:Uncharacterized protein n=1 Tax=Ajellomyces capsulatus TaxID=5037 RepID=A0A8H8CXK9_AJECA|nr:hypothetical protein I7I52_05150 [Histoplasma capsulatum]QSS75187.1 hypothetical protein I7I50_04242 [Histoplasma capsulatum G186AR]
MRCSRAEKDSGGRKSQDNPGKSITQVLFFFDCLNLSVGLEFLALQPGRVVIDQTLTTGENDKRFCLASAA